MNDTSNVPSNASVEWSGNRFGYQPYYSKIIEDILQNKKASKSVLFAAMLEEDKFISAHVILTMSDKMEFETFPTWNKLKIEIEADGRVKIDAEQRFELLEYWKSYLGED